MFVSIIIDNFRRARENMNGDEQVFSLMFNKFQRWTGRKIRILFNRN
jgi:hypothetical protein